MSAGPRLSPAQRAALRRALLKWYRAGARDLPWRRTRDPYRIWLAEMLLQQTRVETAAPYYQRFVKTYPTVRALADADEQAVLGLWAGLGYYNRARNLHQAARFICHERAGRFPRDADALRALPGVGRYTAGAVASIAFAQPTAAVDGNVKRVLARLFCIEQSIDESATTAALWTLADGLLSRAFPGDFNQALMDLGARVCTPRRPNCPACPLRTWCAARARGREHALPLRRAKRPPPVVSALAAYIRKHGRCLLARRPDDGLLGGLWGLPAVSIDHRTPAATFQRHLAEQFGVEVTVGGILTRVEHVFTHRKLQLHVRECKHRAGPPPATRRDGMRWAPRSRLRDYPMSSLDRKVFDRLGLL